MRLTASLLLLASAANALQPGQTPTVTGPATFQTTTRLVVETVGVKDKNGNPIEGLTAKDFTITEDGVPQTIRFFEFQKLPEAAEAPPASPIDAHIVPFAK